MASSLRFLVTPAVDTSVSCLGFLNVSLAPSTSVLVLALFGHNSVLKLQFQLIAQWFPLLSFDAFAQTLLYPCKTRCALVHAILYAVCLGFVV